MGQEMYLEEIKEAVRGADMVLVGLGEEFDDTRSYKEDPGYREGKELLEQSGRGDLIPAWQRMFREDGTHQEEADRLRKGLCNLLHILEDKNYFVVSVSMNGSLQDIPWREGRIVMPCGSDLYQQCSSDCARGIVPLEAREREDLQNQMRNWRQAVLNGDQDLFPQGLGRCPECGDEQRLNNVYHSHYNEQGYLAEWQRYTKWLQGTLNRRLVVLELGVGMQFPSVIRWPFEKVVFFHQKSRFYRINRNLYQMTEELAEKGIGIAENAIDWLQNLC